MLVSGVLLTTYVTGQWKVTTIRDRADRQLATAGPHVVNSLTVARLGRSGPSTTVIGPGARSLSGSDAEANTGRIVLASQPLCLEGWNDYPFLIRVTVRTESPSEKKDRFQIRPDAVVGEDIGVLSAVQDY